MILKGWRAAPAVTALMLGGCADMALSRYVGRDVAEIARRYGPPTDHHTLPSGVEAYRWVISASHRPGADKPLDMFLPVATAPLARRGAAAAGGLLLGGMCAYTVLARWEAGARIWRVVGYRPPRLDCD